MLNIIHFNSEQENKDWYKIGQSGNNDSYLEPRKKRISGT